MDAFKITNTPSFKSLFTNIDDGHYVMKDAVRRHLERWQDIARHYNLRFELEASQQLSGTGQIIGKSFTVISDFKLNGPAVSAEILILGADLLTGKQVLIDSYLINSDRQILSSITHKVIPFKDTSVNEHQAICEAFHAVAEHGRIK